tara:strand:+ start:154 stop:402 length:249 start_codon:yes stop_codon:yes gene_type:complete
LDISGTTKRTRDLFKEFASNIFTNTKKYDIIYLYYKFSNRYKTIQYKKDKQFRKHIRYKPKKSLQGEYFALKKARHSDKERP